MREMGLNGHFAQQQFSSPKCRDGSNASLWAFWPMSAMDPNNDRIGYAGGVRPLGWTASGGGFDSLPGVVFLELCWARSQRGVQSASIVDLIDEARKVGGDIFEGR